MASIGTFNAAEVAPQVGFKPVPPGKYAAVIAATEEKPIRSGKGACIQFTFEITAGDHKTRQLWAYLNLKHTDPKPRAYAQAELSAICRAVGALRITNTNELHGLPIILEVGIKRRDDTKELANVITGYERSPEARTPPGDGIPI